MVFLFWFRPLNHVAPYEETLGLGPSGREGKTTLRLASRDGPPSRPRRDRGRVYPFNLFYQTFSARSQSGREETSGSGPDTRRRGETGVHGDDRDTQPGCRGTVGGGVAGPRPWQRRRRGRRTGRGPRRSFSGPSPPASPRTGERPTAGGPSTGTPSSPSGPGPTDWPTPGTASLGPRMDVYLVPPLLGVTPRPQPPCPSRVRVGLTVGERVSFTES